MDFNEIIRLFENVPVDVITALAVFGVNIVTAVGEFGVDVVRALIPGGGVQ